MKSLAQFVAEGGWEGEDEDSEYLNTHTCSTRLPMSHMNFDAAETHALLHRNGKHELRTSSVPMKNIRATQDWVEKGRGPSPDWGKEKNEYGSVHPTGIKTQDGLVHLVDGHHRADYALGKKQKNLRVSYYEHTGKEKISSKGLAYS